MPPRVGSHRRSPHSVGSPSPECQHQGDQHHPDDLDRPNSLCAAQLPWLTRERDGKQRVAARCSTFASWHLGPTMGRCCRGWSDDVKRSKDADRGRERACCRYGGCRGDDAGRKGRAACGHRPSSFVPAHTLERLLDYPPGRMGNGAVQPGDALGSGHRRSRPGLVVNWSSTCCTRVSMGSRPVWPLTGWRGRSRWVQARRDRSDPLHHRGGVS